MPQLSVYRQNPVDLLDSLLYHRLQAFAVGGTVRVPWRSSLSFLTIWVWAQTPSQAKFWPHLTACDLKESAETTRALSNFAEKVTNGQHGLDLMIRTITVPNDPEIQYRIVKTAILEG